MELKIEKEQMVNLSLDSEVLPIEMTPHIGGASPQDNYPSGRTWPDCDATAIQQR